MLLKLCPMFYSSCHISLDRVLIHGDDQFLLCKCDSIQALPLLLQSTVLKLIKYFKWRKVAQRRQLINAGSVNTIHMVYTPPNPALCPLQTWLINHLFPIQFWCSFRILLITVLQDATSTGLKFGVELRPICHSGSNRTKTKHQKQQTGTNPSSFPGSKRLPASSAFTPPTKPIFITVRA